MLLLLSALCAIVLIGCPMPEAYVRSSEIALQNSKNLDANVDIFAKNYYTFIAKDTERLVKEGKMNEEARTKVLENVEKQMANLKEQSVINRKFVLVAHDQAHEEGLDVNDVLLAIKTVNESYPDIKEFIDKLKGE